mgnify:CR=1 FL=1
MGKHRTLSSRKLTLELVDLGLHLVEPRLELELALLALALDALEVSVFKLLPTNSQMTSARPACDWSSCRALPRMLAARDARA